MGSAFVKNPAGTGVCHWSPNLAGTRLSHQFWRAAHAPQQQVEPFEPAAGRITCRHLWLSVIFWTDSRGAPSGGYCGLHGLYTTMWHLSLDRNPTFPSKAPVSKLQGRSPVSGTQTQWFKCSVLGYPATFFGDLRPLQIP